MKTVLFYCLLAGLPAYSQKERAYITEENVSRVLRQLSADGMMGRPAMLPARLEPATALIENEFASIGLKPFGGLSGYRQEFHKMWIRPETADVYLNGERMGDEEVFVLSDKRRISVSRPLPINIISYDPSGTNADQQFFSQVSTLMRDTISSLILVAPEFQKGFLELKQYLTKRIVNNRRYVKVFLLHHKDAVTSFSVSATQSIDTVKMTNVVGMLEGTSRADEWVVFSAHYDHIGILPPVNNDSIANGADDDASGTTAVIELARFFKRENSNNRSLIFVAFTAEEIGGFGSRHFSQQIDPARVMAMLNIEMIGKTSLWGQNAAFITGFDRSDLGEILERNVAERNFHFRPDPYPEQDLFYRSDNATLARLGVPAHTISTDQIDVDKFYHTVDDEFSTLDIRNVTNTIRAIAAGSKSIVEGVDTPTRIDPSTVR